MTSSAPATAAADRRTSPRLRRRSTHSTASRVFPTPGRAEDRDEVRPAVAPRRARTPPTICSSSRSRPTIGVSSRRSSGAASGSTASITHAPSRGEPVDRVAHEPPGAGVGEHLARRRAASRRRARLVDRRAGDERIAGHDLAGREPDPARDRPIGARARRGPPAARRRRARRERRRRRAAGRCRPALHRRAVASRARAPRPRCARGAPRGAPPDRPADVVGRDVGDEHGHGLALLRAERPRGLGGSAPGRRVERRVPAQHGPLELLKLAARLRPELVDEGPPGRRIRLERVRLPARAVERDDQLRRAGARGTAPARRAPRARRRAPRAGRARGRPRSAPRARRGGAPRGAPRPGRPARRRGRRAAGRARARAPRASRSAATAGSAPRASSTSRRNRSRSSSPSRDAQQVARRPRDEPLAELPAQAGRGGSEATRARTRGGASPQTPSTSRSTGDDAVRLQQQQRRAPPAAARRRAAAAARRRAPPAGRGS